MWFRYLTHSSIVFISSLFNNFCKPRTIKSSKAGYVLQPSSIIYFYLPSSWPQDECEAVPHRATIYAQLVESERMWAWNKLLPIHIGMEDRNDKVILPTKDMDMCAGCPCVYDIQLNQVNQNHFTTLTEVTEIFRYDQWFPAGK